MLAPSDRSPAVCALHADRAAHMNRHLDTLCERAGVPRIRFHGLSHSCASLLYDQGVSIENIQDVLGHSSPTVTKTIYVEATRKIQRDAVDRLGFLFDE
jgi:integrase